MSEITYYFDKIAEEFNGYYTGQRPSFIQEVGYRLFRGPGLKRRFIDTVKITGECAGANILDAGCGPGIYTQYFAKNGAKVTSIDIAPAMIEIARKNLLTAGIKGCKLITGDFMTYDFTDIFDYTLAIGVFDYIQPSKRDEYFKKLRKITYRKIVATFPKKFTFQAPIRRAMFFIKRQPVYFYTKRHIIELARRNNLFACFHNSGPIWTVEFRRI